MSAVLAPIRVGEYLPPICPECVEQDGLCRRDQCRRAVLPQMAKPALVRLIGDVLVEQKKRQRQKGDKLDPKEKVAVARIGRRNARRAARQKRGGYFGLARAIMKGKRS